MQKIINSLVEHAIKNNFIDKSERSFYRNLLLGEFNLPYLNDELASQKDVAHYYQLVGKYAKEKLKIDETFFINKIANILLLSPAKVNQNFQKIALISTQKAFNYFYNLALASYYIKYDQLAKNYSWNFASSYGDLKLTINLAKPEKTPQSILKNSLQNLNYPQCPLCLENIGLSDNGSRSKQNIRFVTQKLVNKHFFMHYSPYSYFNQHLIINSFKHEKMIINSNTFEYLLTFISKYPFYFIGSNCDLPIVGGSILNHFHYQGGLPDLPIFMAKDLKSWKINKVEMSTLNWPLATIKLTSKSWEDLVPIATTILKLWEKYENPALEIKGTKNGTLHNGITPLAIYQNDQYQLYLILRNNQTTQSFAQGKFHIHPEHWHLKKENIGLIEAGGLAILPGRLKQELEQIAKALKNQKINLSSNLAHHHKWYKSLYKQYNKQEIQPFLDKQIGQKFVQILQNCHVFELKANIFNDFIVQILKYV